MNKEKLERANMIVNMLYNIEILQNISRVTSTKCGESLCKLIKNDQYFKEKFKLLVDEVKDRLENEFKSIYSNYGR